MKYSELAWQLKTAMERGEYPPGMRLPSARELAREHGCGYMTADRALNSLAESGWIRRVPRSGSFVCGGGADAPLLVGFADAKFHHPAFDLAAGFLRQLILEEFRKLNCKVRMLSDADLGDPEWLRELDLLLIAHPVDARQGRVLESLGTPVLLFRSEWVRELPFHQVTIDLAPGFAGLFRRLSPERFSRLVILSEGHELSDFRRDTALRFTLESGFPAERIECVTGSAADYPLWKKLLADCRGTFFFTCGDMLAASLLGAALAEGVVIGREFVLAGYDNLESCGYLPFGKPLISSVGYDRREAAKAIARLARQLLNDSGDTALRTILSVPTRLTLRQTFKGE